MQYTATVDGVLSPDATDRVFAHETGHVFNAPDEYTSCKCYSYYGKGTCKAINVNCKSCTSSQEDCIMDAKLMIIKFVSLPSSMWAGAKDMEMIQDWNF